MRYSVIVSSEENERQGVQVRFGDEIGPRIGRGASAYLPNVRAHVLIKHEKYSVTACDKREGFCGRVIVFRRRLAALFSDSG
jgi:hypothetical protein